MCERGELEEVLTDVAAYLKNVDFLYDFSNVTVLSQGHMDRIPAEWTAWFRRCQIKEVKDLLCRKCSPAPPSLVATIRQGQELLERVKKLLKASDSSQAAAESWSPDAILSQLTPSMLRKVTPKKVHEISVMSQYVGSMCREQGIGCVIDVGAGLGYLDQALSREHGLKIISIEGDEEHCLRAELRIRDDPNIRQMQAWIEHGDNFESFQPILNELPPGEKVGLIGLHCCGNLSPTLISLFRAQERLRLLAVVSCCYQKMAGSSSSIFMSSWVQAMQPTDHLSTPFALRLAGQEPISTWLEQSEEAHLEHQRTFGCRAVLEVYAQNKKVVLKKLKRRAVRRTRTGSNLEVMQSLVSRYDLGGQPDPLRELLALCDDHEDSFQVLEILTGLQLFLQPFFEYFILLDRLLYLRESGHKDAVLSEIFDPQISPRNTVISCLRS